MRALTNSEKSYNNLLSRVSEIKFYVQTTCDRRDENYYNKLFLKALVEQDPYALNEYSKIQEIISMPKEERSKLLDYDENGELNIQKYGLSEHSKIYVLSRYLDIKELLKIEGSTDKFEKLRKFGVPEIEILKIICDEKNRNLQEFILKKELEDSHEGILPAVNFIFNDKENVRKLLFLTDACSIDILKNIIDERYGKLNGEEADLIILNSTGDKIENILQDLKLFVRKTKIA